MEDTVYAAVWTQGQMSMNDVRKECGSEKWVPLLVMRLDEEVIVPIFTRTQVARRFIERNLPKGSVCGVVNLTIRDAEWMDSKGWQAKMFDHPRKVADLVEFDIEVLEYDSDHEVEVRN